MYVLLMYKFRKILLSNMSRLETFGMILVTVNNVHTCLHCSYNTASVIMYNTVYIFS